MRPRLITILTVATLAAGCFAASSNRAHPVSAPATASATDSIGRDLALATFDSAWGKIKALHYDSLMNGIDWNEARSSLRPRAESARTTAQLRSVISALLSRMKESHYTLIPREASVAFTSESATTADSSTPGDLGIEMRLVDRAVVVISADNTSPAYAAGMRPGWEISAIGAVEVAANVAAIDSITTPQGRRNARTRLILLLQAASRGATGTKVMVRGNDLRGNARPMQIARRRTPGDPVKYGNLPTVMARVSAMAVTPRNGVGCMGIIRFNTWMPSVAGRIDEAVDSLRSCKGLIIDLRGNTGGVANMVVGIAGHFLTGRDTLGTMKTRAGALRLIANPRMSNAKGERVEPFAGRVALLVDELSASTSEIFAGALQSLGRARVFGDTTAGQALPATLYRLPNNDVLMLAVADFRGPRGERIEGNGIVPDVIQRIHRSDLLAGRDAVVESALDWISSGTY